MAMNHSSGVFSLPATGDYAVIQAFCHASNSDGLSW
jgi:hypothetical protein